MSRSNMLLKGGGEPEGSGHPSFLWAVVRIGEIRSWASSQTFAVPRGQKVLSGFVM